MQNSTMSPVYTDFSDFAAMRAQAKVDPDSSLKQVAKQFEGIFIHMMLKSMRDASMGDPVFDSDQSKFYRDMFDQQIALDMSNSKGIGLADALVRQLGGKDLPETKTKDEPLISGKILPHSMDKMNPVASGKVRGLSHFELPVLHSLKEKTEFNSTAEFTNTLLPYAEKAANVLGISPEVLIAQAALETGWGKAMTRDHSGVSSFNLFNIKAGNNWQGKHVIKSTLEYENGLAKHEKAAFRAYDSYADSFDDYVDFLRSNTRYDSALRNEGNDQLFIQNLHKAGYATDPNYARKVLDILNRDSFQAQLKTDAGDLDGHV